MRKKTLNPKRIMGLGLILMSFMLLAAPLWASEAELAIPVLTPTQNNLLMIGFLVCFVGMAFGLYEYKKVKSLPGHKSMLDISEIIFQTCKTYLIQQGKFLIILEIFIGACMVYYFGFLQHTPAEGVLLILAWSVVGILGSGSA
jgi:K(+)-stimulated pyrophosphate-energized sodium pump